MSTIEIDAGTMRRAAPNADALAPAAWLSLAAAPTFAIMALLSGAFGGKPDVLCAAIQGTSPLSGMVPMYLLMSAFHLPPWLRLIRRTRRATHDLGPGLRSDKGGFTPEMPRARPP